MHKIGREIEAQSPKQVHKSDLHPGDYMLVKTSNSLYRIRVLGDGRYQVQGGWFNRHRATATPTTIEGCSWRGRVMQSSLVAAEGFSLAFGNRVVTSPIKAIRLLPAT